MVEFECSTNTFNEPVPYSVDGMRSFDGLSVCGSGSDGIVLVDGCNGHIFEFNPKDKMYKLAAGMEAVGNETSCLVVNGNVHIIHGHKPENYYPIYSMNTGKVTLFKEEPFYSSTKTNVPFIKQCDDTPRLSAAVVCAFWIRTLLLIKDGGHFDVTKLVTEFYDVPLVFYKFGGYDDDANGATDSFFIGKLQEDDAGKPVIWEQAEQFKLRQPMWHCGVIQSGPFIVTFGGIKWMEAVGLDEVYILDTRSKRGWIESQIKCPVKSGYVAVLDYEDGVHLFTWNGEDYGVKHGVAPQHFSISLEELIPEFGTLKALRKRVRI